MQQPYRANISHVNRKLVITNRKVIVYAADAVVRHTERDVSNLALEAPSSVVLDAHDVTGTVHANEVTLYLGPPPARANAEGDRTITVLLKLAFIYARHITMKRSGVKTRSTDVIEPP